MKFLLDAHLPRRLRDLLESRGHDVRHTLELAERNETKDRVLNRISFEEQRIVVSKDTDFFYSHMLQGRPWKLLQVRTGNVSTRDLTALFERNLPAIEAAFGVHSLVEIDRFAVPPVK